MHPDTTSLYLNRAISDLNVGSYVTMFPHVAFYMGLYYVNTGRTWSDKDLVKPYKFGDKIYFKKGYVPDGIPTLYRVEISNSDIEMHHNFPFEFTIKGPKKARKMTASRARILVEQSKKYLRLCEEITF